MVLVLLETVSFNESLRFEIWVEIQECGGLDLMVLNVAGEDLERNINRKQKGFLWMRQVWLVGRGGISELLLEVFQIKDHNFWFIGDRWNEKLKGFSYIGDNGFKRFSGVSWSVSGVRNWSVTRYSNIDGYWLFSQRVQYSGPDIQGKISDRVQDSLRNKNSEWLD